MQITVGLKGALTARNVKKNIFGITRTSFKGYTSSQYMHKANKAKYRY